MTSGRSQSDALPHAGRRPGPAGVWLLGFAAALTLYVLTLLPNLAWQDSGEYQWSAAKLVWPPTVESPWCRPGEAVRVHPWFLVTARLVGAGPWSAARAANLTSALSMALAVANVALLALLVTGRRRAALVAGLAMAVGHTVWTFGVMSEVLGWTAALVSAEMLCAWAWGRQGRTRWLVLLFLANGIAISNHMMAALSLIVWAGWVVVLCVRRKAPAWVIPAGLGAWLVGGTLYWIVLGIEYGLTGSLEATLVSATVGGFGGAAWNLAAAPSLFGRSVLYVGLNYPTPLALLIVVGAVVLVRRRDGFGRAIVVLGVVLFVWAARYRVPDQFSFFVPFYAVSSVWIGVGAAWVLVRWPRATVVLVGLALLPVGVYAVLPRASRAAGFVFFQRELPYRDPYRYFLQPWKCGERSARRFAEEALEALPPRALLLPDTTPEPPLVYVQEMEGRRPDVEVVGPYEARFDPTVARYWESETNLMPELRAEGRRVFVVSAEPGYVPPWVRKHGRLVPFADILYEVRPRGSEGGP